MKKTILSACLVAVFLGTAGLAQESKGRPAATKLDGAWKLVSHKNGDRKEHGPVAEGETQTKLLVDGRYVWTVVRDGKVSHGLGGRYTLQRGKYTENIEFAFGEEFARFVGKAAEFKWAREEEKWLHQGVVKIGGADYSIDEVWERQK